MSSTQDTAPAQFVTATAPRTGLSSTLARASRRSRRYHRSPRRARVDCRIDARLNCGAGSALTTYQERGFRLAHDFHLPIGVSVLQNGQHREAAEAIAAGHANYPAFRYVFADAGRRARALPPFFAATVRDAIPFGAVLAVSGGDAGVHAVAVWLPPGGFPWTPRRKARATVDFARVFLADPRAYPTFIRYGANLERAHPADPHWYLVVMSVRPEFQRQGLGTRLAEPVLQRADRDRVACYLETSDPANVAFYERLGFEVVNPDLRVIPGGPPLIAMRRAAPKGGNDTS
jgi:ribosomal protein S18 acetylase RimI-like enzyme